MGLFKQRLYDQQRIEDELEYKYNNACKDEIRKLIEDRYEDIGIPESRVKFMQNKWNMIFDSDIIAFCEEPINIKVSPSVMQEDSIKVCKQLGVKTSDYKDIWQAAKVVSKYLRDNANNYEINSVDIEGMNIDIRIRLDAIYVKYKCVVFTFKDGRTNISKSIDLPRYMEVSEKNLELFNLDKAMIGVLGALCETKLFIEDTEKWS